MDVTNAEYVNINGSVPDAFSRPIIKDSLSTGIRAIDSLLTMGTGQRMGLFAGSGVGKSTTLGMIARNSEADVNVMALIGERGREVKEFMEDSLGPEGMKKVCGCLRYRRPSSSNPYEMPACGDFCM